MCEPDDRQRRTSFVGSNPTPSARSQGFVDPPGAHLQKGVDCAAWCAVQIRVYLEMETAFPNSGSAKYVTGPQPNVRPQRLVLILQRRVSVNV